MRFGVAVLFALPLAVASAQGTSNALTLQAELTASDGGPSEYFGSAVAVSGDTAVVGADWKTIGGQPQAGAAYVFVRSGLGWVQQAELLPLDVTSYSYFGTSVAISGNTVVVGAFQKDLTGAAYVFERSGTVWTQLQKLTASDGAFSDHFGGQVAIQGGTLEHGTIVIGASWKNNKTGAAYVFASNGTSWAQAQELTGSDSVANDLFGYAVRVNGGTVFIGAPFHDSIKGATYVFPSNGTVWVEQQELTASDASPVSEFGFSIDASGNTLVIGSTGHFGHGVAYVFARKGGAWMEQQILTSDDPASQVFFGWSVAASGNTVVVGEPRTILAQGEAFVYVHTGGTWSLVQDLTPPDPVTPNFYGWTVALDGGTGVIGAFGNGGDTGAAYVYTIGQN